MSIWRHNPEWFDDWLEQQALDGRFGKELQEQAEAGAFLGYEQWAVLDTDGKLGAEATEAYCTRLVP